MKLDDLLFELEKARGWAGGGNPDVTAGEREIAFAKIANGSISLELDSLEDAEILKSLQADIEDAEGEADSIITSAKESAEDAIDDAISALERVVDRLPRTLDDDIIEDIRYQIRYLENQKANI